MGLAALFASMQHKQHAGSASTRNGIKDALAKERSVRESFGGPGLKLLPSMGVGTAVGVGSLTLVGYEVAVVGRRPRGALATAVVMDAAGTALAVLVADGSVKATLATTTTFGAAVVAGVADVEPALVARTSAV